jgi:muramidase (phage lysozyme)
MKRRYFVMGGVMTGAVVLSRCNRSPKDLAARAIRALENRPQIGGTAIAAEGQQISREIVEGLMLRAFLRVIYWAEGTYPNARNMDPYRIIFSYKLAPGYDDHPRQCIPIDGHPRGYCSDAAGIGQFLSTTYDGIWVNHPDALIKDIPYFDPRNQDRAMAILVGNTGAYWSLAQGTSWKGTDEGIFTTWDAFARAINQAATEWASLPLPNGLSIGHGHGGQRAHTMKDLWDVYQQHLNSWKNVVATS